MVSLTCVHLSIWAVDIEKKFCKETESPQISCPRDGTNNNFTWKKIKKNSSYCRLVYNVLNIIPFYSRVKYYIIEIAKL